MRQLLLVLVATAPLSSCQYLSAGEDIEIIDPIAKTIEAQERVAEAGQDIASTLDGGAENEVFEDPTVEAPSIITADLIQSTDPSARAQAVARSRSDPFATLPIPLAPKLVDLPKGPSTGAGNASSGRSVASPRANTPAKAAGPTPPAVRVREQPLAEPSPIAMLPPIPQPVIAPTVAVSGVIQLGGTPYAIVRSGGEPERYVKVGDRIANGSVRVKRIETLAYEPRVIFEENGIEVSKPISGDRSEGEATPTENPVTEPVAAVPAAASRSVAALPTPATPAPTGITGQAATLRTDLPLPPASSLLQPARGNVPNSLLLLPPEGDFQTRLPGKSMGMPSKA